MDKKNDMTLDLNSLMNPKPYSVWDDYVPILESENNRRLDVYLTGGIALPPEYAELYHSMVNMPPASEVHLHITNGGGYIDGALLILQAIAQTQAKVIAHVAGSVASAASMITLCCDEVVTSRFMTFMLHEASGGAEGKFSDIKNMQAHYEKLYKDLSVELYTGFLSAEEIEVLHEGKELWFNERQFKDRWSAMKASKPYQPHLDFGHAGHPDNE